MGFDVAVLGSANLDLVLHVGAWPVGGETVMVTGSHEAAGGKGLNQAVAAARAGARTAFVGAVGDDEPGRLLRDTLREEGVDVTALRTATAPTGRAIVVVQPSGENTIFVVPGSNHDIELDDGARRVLGSSRVVVTQLEIPMHTVMHGVRVAADAGAVVLLNAAPAAPVDQEVLDAVDLLVVNEHEAAALSGVDDPQAAGTALTARAGRVVVTLGAAGALSLTRTGDRDDVPGLPARPVDTTAAGDTFVGYLAACSARDTDPAEGLRLAVAAGALAVERHGAVPSIPGLVDVEERLRRHTGQQGRGEDA